MSWEAVVRVSDGPPCAQTMDSQAGLPVAPKPWDEEEEVGCGPGDLLRTSISQPLPPSSTTKPATGVRWPCHVPGLSWGLSLLRALWLMVARPSGLHNEAHSV
mmetsp:Transcript_82749/g.146550  ORF Transcript_82749/g.146550 Transcript_82749/m.146550 type:complete len:103 (+) Transcript_82749:145-453(+)